MAKAKFYFFDKIIIAYSLFLTILILVFGRPLANYVDEIMLNILYIAIVFIIVLGLSGKENKIACFFRFLYPIFLFTVFYEQTGGLMRLFFPEFIDHQLTTIEKGILGINPTLWMDQNLIKTGLTEILMAGYFSYYFMIPIYLVSLFFLKEYRLILKSLAAIEITFFISYILFFLYPIEGPRYFLANLYQTEITGPLFRKLVVFLQTHGSVHGGCMPSSHVAVAVVIIIFCLKYFKKAGIILIPINIGLALGAVYGRYHYLSDVIVGAVMGMVVTFFVLRLYKANELNETQKNIKDEALSHVS